MALLATRYFDPRTHYPLPSDPALCERSHPRFWSSRVVTAKNQKMTHPQAKELGVGGVSMRLRMLRALASSRQGTELLAEILMVGAKAA